MQGLAIVVLCVVAACGYGIVHDQITARICVEYFTIGHPQILSFPTESPTLLGFVWGIAATWWVGLALGLALAVAARLGPRPKKSVREVVKPVLVLLVAMGILALVAGIAGYLIALTGVIRLWEPIESAVPRSAHARFIGDLFAHNMSYLAGFVGGIIVIKKTWRSRSSFDLSR